jgi:hypothetical protein
VDAVGRKLVGPSEIAEAASHGVNDKMGKVHKVERAELVRGIRAARSRFYFKNRVSEKSV